MRGKLPYSFTDKSRKRRGWGWFARGNELDSWWLDVLLRNGAVAGQPGLWFVAETPVEFWVFETAAVKSWEKAVQPLYLHNYRRTICFLKMILSLMPRPSLHLAIAETSQASKVIHLENWNRFWWAGHCYSTNTHTKKKTVMCVIGKTIVELEEPDHTSTTPLPTVL